MDLIGLWIERAMAHPGCPICRRRDEAELHYIETLLWENVNDSNTRAHLIASLGYCPQHTWQTGLLERDEYKVPLGTARIHQQLAMVIQRRLERYASRVLVSHQPRWKKWLHALLPSLFHLSPPYELQPMEPCRVCQIGDETVRTGLEWLLDVLTDDGAARKTYAASDGLCLRHLRQALCMATRANQPGIEFLVENMIERLDALQHHLDEFARKEAWQYRHEEKTEPEKRAWVCALVFLGGNAMACDKRGEKT